MDGRKNEGADRAEIAKNANAHQEAGETTSTHRQHNTEAIDRSSFRFTFPKGLYYNVRSV